MEEKLYQVNHTTYNDGSENYFITEYSEDGYRGTLIDTRYLDGSVDETCWCVYTGTKAECEQYIDAMQ